MTDSLEARLKSIDITAADAFTLAFEALRLLYMLAIVDGPRKHRAIKDGIIKDLKQCGLSREALGLVSDEITAYCDAWEETK